MSQAIRREDHRLIRGRGMFVDDEQSRAELHLKFVRSPYAHANLQRVGTSAAEAHPDVVCVLTGEDVKRWSNPFLQMGPGAWGKLFDYCMAVDRVRYQGEPVAAIVATSPAAAEDGAQLVQVDYEPLDAVVDAVVAIDSPVLLHPMLGTNRTFDQRFEWGEVDAAFRDATSVVRIDRLHFHRFSGTPLEPYAAIATWTGDGGVDFLCNVMQPGIAINVIAPALRISPDRVRIRTQDIGGSFGIKQHIYTYLVATALASRKAGGRPIKWIETRREHLQASAHGSERTFLDTEVALDANGVITAVQSRHIDDCGAYPRYEPLGCVIWSQVAPATYKLRNLRIDFLQAVTNKCPSGPNRGYSRMQHIWFLERVVDICARQLGIAPDEMRRRNYIDQFPYETPNGCVYDSGDYHKMLRIAQDLIGWEDWLRRIEEARRAGRRIGIGIGTTLDSGTNNFGQSRIVNPHSPFTGNSEVANIRLGFDGSLTVAVGSVPQGQGHETVAAQVVAAELGIPEALVYVQIGFDTERGVHTSHSGTYASQFAVSGISAIHGALEKLRAEILRLAAYVLEQPPDALVITAREGAGVVESAAGGRKVSFAELSGLVNSGTAGLPEHLADVTLNCRYVYRAPFEVPDLERKFGNLTLTYASQLHIVVIEIDPDTFGLLVLDYAIVDECGRVINHKIVRGQVQGATAHGIGAALMEAFHYDPDGNLMTATFSDYCPITILNMPALKDANIECPSPFTYNGAKGMGEGGGTPLHAIAAAIQDAIGDGHVVGESHHSPDGLFAALTGSARGATVRLERRELASSVETAVLRVQIPLSYNRG